jgi:hypothetical protein
MEHECFLIAEGALVRALGDGIGYAPGQGTDGSVRKKSFFACDREFVSAQFLIGQDFV